MINSSEFTSWNKEVINGDVEKQVEYIIQRVSSIVFEASLDEAYTNQADKVFFVISCKYTRYLLYNKKIMDEANSIL